MLAMESNTDTSGVLAELRALSQVGREAEALQAAAEEQRSLEAHMRSMQSRGYMGHSGMSNDGSSVAAASPTMPPSAYASKERTFPSGEPKRTEGKDHTPCFVYGSTRATVSMEAADLMRTQAIEEYRECRAQGATWLWQRAVHRAGGSRTISLFIVRLWHNHVRTVRGRSKVVGNAISRMSGRSMKKWFEMWRVEAKKERRERMQNTMRSTYEAEINQLKEEVTSLKGEMQEKDFDIDDLKRELTIAQSKMMDDDEIDRLETNTENANTRAQKAELSLLSAYECIATLFDTLMKTSRHQMHGLSQPAYRSDLRPVVSTRVQNMMTLKKLLPHQIEDYDPFSTERLGHPAPVQVSLYEAPVPEPEPEPEPAPEPSEGDGEAAPEGETPKGDDAKEQGNEETSETKEKPQKSVELPKNEEGVDEYKKMRAAPTNIAELLVLEWANSTSRLAEKGSEVGSNMPAWRPLKDFAKSCEDGTQLTRIIYYLMVSSTDKVLASTSDPPVNVDPGLVVPKLWSRNITEIQEDTFKNDVNIAKDKPKELQELLEEFARKTLGLPTALLRAEDLRRHDATWNFALFSYLMMTSPGMRTNSHSSEVFQTVMKLEEAASRWRKVKQEMDAEEEEEMVDPYYDEVEPDPEEEQAKEANKRRLKAERLIPRGKAKVLDPGAPKKPEDIEREKKEAKSQPSSINQISDIISTANELCAQINQMSASAHYGQRLWDASMRTVLEKSYSELAKRGRMTQTGGSHGFHGAVVVPPRF